MKRAARHILPLGALAFLLVVAAAGCSPVKKSISSTFAYYEKGALVHQVRWEGETLSVVARWYTGNMENWRAIADANPTLDPNKMIIGNVIRIPSALLVTRKPMPKDFLSGSNDRSAPRPPPAASSRPDGPAAQRGAGSGPAEAAHPKPRAHPTPAEPAEAPPPPGTSASPSLQEKEHAPAAASSPQKESGQGASAAAPAAQPSVHSEAERHQDAGAVQPTKKEEEPPLFGPKDYHGK